MNNDLRKLQKIELTLLEKLKEICKKYDLTYYAACGTLLGAIRHKGFIPWDDDMDLFLPWPDYQKLMEVAPRECEYPFFFQSIYTERDAMANASRLRRSDTTGFTRWEYENVGPCYDLGIFIDIFPLFFVPDSAEERAMQKEKVMHAWRCIHGHDAYVQQKRGGFVNKQYESYFPEFRSLCEGKGLSVDNDITWLKEQYLEACVWNERTKEVGTTSSRCHKPTLMWDAEWFDRTVELPFENTTIICPAEFEKILVKSYGDWRTPVMGASDHEMVAVDTETPLERVRYVIDLITAKERGTFSVEQQSIGNRILRGTMIIVLVGVLAKFAAFIEEAVLAAYLGTTSQSDAYYMVWSVHAVVYPMMSIGIWNVFLPLYKSHIAKDEKETAFALTNKSLSFFTLVSCGVVILLIAFAPIVVSVVAPGFKDGTRELCIRLVRISAPMYVLIIASAVYAAVLRCHDQFLGSQIREVASHVPTILAAFFFYRKFGIETMAIALVVAGLLRLLIELPFVNWGYRYKPDLDFRSEEFRLMLKRLPSALVSAGVAQLNALIDKAMASLLPEGTVSCLNYGHKLMNVFSGLLSSAIAAATYPQMIELIALDKKEELGKLLEKIINIFCVLMFPITMACILFRKELVSAVFERGAFNAKSTALTASVFALYCIGLFFVAVSTVVSNVFYGHGDTKTPMYISLTNLGINVVLNIILISVWGVNGLALATSLSAVISFFLRIRAARKYVQMKIRGILITAGKVSSASAVACFIPRTIFWIWPVNKFILLICSALIGVLVYFLMMKILKVPELDELLSLVDKKIKRA